VLKGDTSLGGPRREFPSTRWSAVLAVRDPSDPARQKHLEALIRTYWKPAYAYVRALRPGCSEEAKDITQEFFARLLEHGSLSTVDPQRGSFRGFLRTSLRNFVIDVSRRERARRPPPGTKLLPFDEVRDGPADSDTPDSAFEREWNRTVLQEAVEELEQQLHRAGLSDHAELFRSYCFPKESKHRPTHRELAAEFGISESGIRKRLTYCQRSLREILRDRIREYVTDDRDLETELGEILRG